LDITDQGTLWFYPAHLILLIRWLVQWRCFMIHSSAT